MVVGLEELDVVVLEVLGELDVVVVVLVALGELDVGVVVLGELVVVASNRCVAAIKEKS